MLKKEKQMGITLISLIITIILLLILAAVAINLAVESNGLFGKAEGAANKWNEAVATEQEVMQELLSYGDNLNESKYIMVSVTNEEYILLDKEGDIWTCSEQSEPQKLDTGNIKYKYIAQTLALDEDGNIWDDITGTPQKIEGLGTTFKALAASDTTYLALDEEGNIWTWGQNYYGQLGDGTTTDKTEPQKLEGIDVTFKDIAAGDRNSAAIDTAGNIWTWGYNYRGQLGDGTTTDKTEPQKLEGIEATFKDISIGYLHMAAIDIAGNVWTWGYNGDGQLGDGTTTDKTEPQKLEGLNAQFKSIVICSRENLALDENGYIWLWGSYYNYIDISRKNLKIPQKLEIQGNKFENVGAGNEKYIAVDEENNVFYRIRPDIVIDGGYSHIYVAGYNIVDEISSVGDECYLARNGKVLNYNCEVINGTFWYDVIGKYSYNESILLLDDEEHIYISVEDTITYEGKIEDLSAKYKIENDKLYVKEETEWIECSEDTTSENDRIVLNDETSECFLAESIMIPFDENSKYIGKGMEIVNVGFNPIGTELPKLIKQYSDRYGNSYFIDSNGDIWHRKYYM